LLENRKSKDIEKKIKIEIKTISSTLDLLREKLDQIERIGQEEEISKELTPAHKFYIRILYVLLENNEFLGKGRIGPTITEMDINYLIDRIGSKKIGTQIFKLSEKDLEKNIDGEISWHVTIKNAVMQLKELNYIDFYILKNAVADHHIKLTVSGALNLRDYDTKPLIFSPEGSKLKIKITNDKYQLLSRTNEVISEEYSEEVSITCKNIIDAIRVWGIELPSVNSYSEKMVTNKFLTENN